VVPVLRPHAAPVGAPDRGGREGRSPTRDAADGDRGSQDDRRARGRIRAADHGTVAPQTGGDEAARSSRAIWTARTGRAAVVVATRAPHAPLGPADGPVKRAIFGETSALLYGYGRRADLSKDRIALHRDAYERDGPGRTNRRYGFVARSAG